MIDSLSRRRALLLCASAPLAAAGMAPAHALAQGSVADWPGSRPIRIIVAYPAGGVSDVMARALGDRLSAQLGTPVIVDNKAGAGGAIAMDAVAKAPADGHTLGFSSISPLVLSPHLGRLPFDPVRDIAPVASVMVSPVLLLATAACTARDFPALVAQAKARPGEVRWATSGQASLGHIMLEQIMQASGAKITHVPYKGGGQQLNDALSGQFEILSTNAGPAVAQHIQGGKLRALAVGAPQRVDGLPAIPTLAELGMPAANLSSQFGIFAPGKTPAVILERLNAEINKALAWPELRAKLVSTGNVPMGGASADFAREIARESQGNAAIIRAARIQLD
ncbi:tripartite tricarboxylate transporter substrate binding protein [Paracidovorax citrulli]|uniref:Bug family tripartite tricarboxylate transporter substrate binding protein n=1 Tax=Paracidovorax citrulli TaxID=80869 RepID=UPI0002DE7640|nr:tripartite tricarboxylate transporter substrate binding protein [Paracidovorax citrulli]UEG45203.1 tripartite tricarboxylate transporter substrate binding protein [Paracidovorax citrulli]UMT87472.1 tripartite tricarboxylate transporter substrate binding protein [Paracidovorax citrulli]UMT95509.1 tripartite tricarboxylate transporter substrate binding protein [Paracidovorax citrulli]WIY33664.1 tripartite tricarboxylate transporter substrate binding protein [Paracidovorax citrulli]